MWGGGSPPAYTWGASASSTQRMFIVYKSGSCAPDQTHDMHGSSHAKPSHVPQRKSLRAPGRLGRHFDCSQCTELLPHTLYGLRPFTPGPHMCRHAVMPTPPAPMEEASAKSSKVWAGNYYLRRLSLKKIVSTNYYDKRSYACQK